jgi:hypothetical protein
VECRWSSALVVDIVQVQHSSCLRLYPANRVALQSITPFCSTLHNASPENIKPVPREAEASRTHGHGRCLARLHFFVQSQVPGFLSVAHDVFLDKPSPGRSKRRSTNVMLDNHQAFFLRRRGPGLYEAVRGFIRFETVELGRRILRCLRTRNSLLMANHPELGRRLSSRLFLLTIRYSDIS